MKKYLCELFGTFVLVLFGCGVAVFTDANIVATSLAFGLSIVALGYVIGSVSGCHVNPAVTISMLINKRISLKDAVCYIVAQVIGAILGSALLMFVIKSTTLGDIDFVGLGANGYLEASATNINLIGALVVEAVLTFVFTFAVLGATDDKDKSTVAPIIIGLVLVLVHLLGIKLTGTSVNPARSLAPAIFMRGIALEQVWVFIVAPIVGAILSAVAYSFIKNDKKVAVKEEVKPIIKEEVKPVKKVTKPEVKSPKKVVKKTTTKKVK